MAQTSRVWRSTECTRTRFTGNSSTWTISSPTRLAARAASLVGDEIVHVELFPVKRVLVHSVDRHTRDVCAIGRHAHARAAGENALHFRFIFGRQRGTQLTVHGFGLLEPAGRRNYARSIGDLDDPHHSNPSLRNISRIPRMACRVRASFSINAILT